MNRDLRRILVLLAAASIALATLPWIASDFMLSLALTCLLYVGLAVSWAMFSGATNYLSLATAAFFGIGAYVTAWGFESLPYALVVLLGGLGSAAGCLAGGMLLGLVEAFGMHFTSPSLKMLLSYSVFIAVLLARPKGLFAR